MARPLRLEFPSAVYHVTARGDRREAIFLDDEDRQRFIHLLGKEVEQQRWLLYAYCLMDNHYHLLLETPEPNLGRGMRRLNGVYTQAFNRRHGLVGHVLQGRYKSILVDRDAYLLELCRYVVLNPIRAGIVDDPAAWRWSSYRATAGEMSAPQWLDTSRVLGLFHPELAAARSAYASFAAQGRGLPSPWANLSGQIYLGGEAFLGRMQGLAATQPPDNIPLEQRIPARPDPQIIIRAVAQTYGIGAERVLDRINAGPFKLVVYLLRRAANLSLKEVAGMANVSSSRVSQIQAEVEGSGELGEQGRAVLRALDLSNYTFARR
jgi:putative transposase